VQAFVASGEATYKGFRHGINIMDATEDSQNSPDEDCSSPVDAHLAKTEKSFQALEARLDRVEGVETEKSERSPAPEEAEKEPSDSPSKKKLKKAIKKTFLMSPKAAKSPSNARSAAPSSDNLATSLDLTSPSASQGPPSDSLKTTESQKSSPPLELPTCFCDGGSPVCLVNCAVDSANERQNAFLYYHTFFSNGMDAAIVTPGSLRRLFKAGVDRTIDCLCSPSLFSPMSGCCAAGDKMVIAKAPGDLAKIGMEAIENKEGLFVNMKNQEVLET